MSRETDIERQFGKRLQEWADGWGIPILYRKFVSPGHLGYPDRVLFWPDGCMFIEWKFPGEKPRKMQEFVHKQMKDLGVTVEVYDDWRVAMEAVTSRICASLRANPRYEADRLQRGRAPLPASWKR